METSFAPRKISEDPQILILEDDQELLDEMRTMASADDVKSLGARCVEDAVAAFNAHSETLRLLIVDMMVPRSRGGLRQLDETDRERKTIIESELGDIAVPVDDSKLQHVRDTLEVIASRSRDLVDIEGGVTFLREIADKLRDSKASVAFLSARAIDSQMIARSRLDSSNRIVATFQKPSDPERLASTIRESQLEGREQ